jgi:hypothetical protein
MDGVRTADEDGRHCEVVVPRWWQLRRWWVWLRAPGHTEFFVPVGGQTRPRPWRASVFLRFRTRPVPRPAPSPVTLRSGKTLVPGPVDPARLRVNPDPTHRLVPDWVLERDGITHRDE